MHITPRGVGVKRGGGSDLCGWVACTGWFSWPAGSEGEGRSSAMAYFEEKYKENMTRDESILMGIKGIYKGSEKKLNNRPSAKIDRVRLIIRITDCPFSFCPYFFMENHIDTPTINRKNGKTRSVGVHPCQLECRKGA